jgi:hypothetical protein
LADSGVQRAAELLPGLLNEQGSNVEAQLLRKFGLDPDGLIALS